MNTTVGGGDTIFAPTWDMVKGHKQFVEGIGTYDDAAYTRDYLARMNLSWKDQEKRPYWLELLHSTDYRALCCFCPPGQFCHRHLLVSIFEKLAKANNVPFFYYGELLP